MIYIAGFYISFMSVLSIIIYSEGKKDKKKRMIYERSQLLKSKRLHRKSPIPFLWMNSALIATFETLCPTKVAVEKYDKSPIPVEILDLLKLSKNEGYFNEVEIWYNEVDKDPVCIGYYFGERSERQSDYWKKAYAEKYLIGRWADVKASLDTLTKKARQVFIQNTKNQLVIDIRRKQRELEDIEETANEKFGGAMPVTDLPF